MGRAGGGGIRQRVKVEAEITVWNRQRSMGMWAGRVVEPEVDRKEADTRKATRWSGVNVPETARTEANERNANHKGGRARGDPKIWVQNSRRTWGR
mmetsp:Transcript_3516/g.7337  ORF Transcript_3516/g.7337 Transcript_3516/m.7337 type:complete len:96 (+) Transcript_3516:96-383(+)